MNDPDAQPDSAVSPATPAELLDMTGRVALVTGASGNIGAGIAERFLMAGATVVAHSRTGSVAEQPRLTNITADLADPNAATQLVDRVMLAHGRVDVLVNNAGIQPTVPFAEITDTQWQEMIDTNLTAAHRLTQATAAAMRNNRTADSNDNSGTNTAGGAIVHVASIEASHPTTEHGHYATAKAGLVMHAKAAALSYGADNIRVNSISPGLISRPGIEEQWPGGVERWKSAAPLGRLGTPADVGDACVFLCSDLARWITGVDLVVDGGVLTRPTW